MKHASSKVHRGGIGLLGAGALVAVLASACSSSGMSGSKSPAAATREAASGGSSAVAVETHSGPIGTFLTDASGKSLYMFASDSATKSTCFGACASFWPPLTTRGNVVAMGGVAHSKLGTLSRSDGTKQVTYGGHPLYYFKLDTSAGDTMGQGSSNFGAKWWLLAPSGQPITSNGGGAP